jgi:hypothetical protein
MGILWKDSELNDTIVEAELRTLRVPPVLPTQQALTKFQDSKNRLLILVRGVDFASPLLPASSPFLVQD